MDTVRLLGELRLQGELLADTAGRTDLATAVPSCPGWTVARTQSHLCRVHRMASWVLRGGELAEFDYPRSEPAMLDAEYRAALAELLDTLGSAPDTLQAFTFWPAKSARLFWARRQAHETAIHRVDVQLAADYGVSDFDPDFAADGIDELLVGMAAGAFSRADVDGPRSIAITPLDANISWTVQLAPAQVGVVREAASNADLSVFGLSSDLYRWVWNRAGDDEVSLRGDVTLADLWRSNFTISTSRN
jgi:uncharacterized protein (TIGR03083 family)